MVGTHHDIEAIRSPANHRETNANDEGVFIDHIRWSQTVPSPGARGVGPRRPGHEGGNEKWDATIELRMLGPLREQSMLPRRRLPASIAKGSGSAERVEDTWQKV